MTALANVPITPVARALTPEQATGHVGHRVPEMEPNVTSELIAVDATTSEPAYAYLPVGDVGRLRRAVLNFAYNGSVSRARGMSNTSRTFGYSPRRPVYGREGCSGSRLADEDPTGHQILIDYAHRVQNQLATIFPSIATADSETMANSGVLGEWRLGETHWTSGIINQSSALPYHRDGFNFDVWTAMPVVRRHSRGGYLHIPEYDTVIASRDGWAVFFPGYALVHGVTPITITRQGGYRYSVVYYALKGMKDCFTHAVEQGYALQRRTEREQSMAEELATRITEAEAT